MKPLSDWTKAQKINSAILGIFAFVFLPLFTAIILSLENPIYHSITEMGFALGHYPIFLLWGLLVIGFTVYTSILTLKESNFRFGVKLAFYILVGVIDVAFLCAGIPTTIRVPLGSTTYKLHNLFAYTMFVGHIFLLLLYAVFSFFRNRLQGCINLVFVAFFSVCTLFSYMRINTKDSFSLLQTATAVSEAAVFCLFALFLYLNYLGNILFPPTGKNKLLSFSLAKNQ